MHTRDWKAATKLQIQDIWETKTPCQYTLLFTLRQIQICEDQAEKDVSNGIIPHHLRKLLQQNCEYMSGPQTSLISPTFTQISHASTNPISNLWIFLIERKGENFGGGKILPPPFSLPNQIFKTCPFWRYLNGLMVEETGNGYKALHL